MKKNIISVLNILYVVSNLVITLIIACSSLELFLTGIIYSGSESTVVVIALIIIAYGLINNSIKHRIKFKLDSPDTVIEGFIGKQILKYFINMYKTTKLMTVIMFILVLSELGSGFFTFLSVLYVLLTLGLLNINIKYIESTLKEKETETKETEAKDI